MGDQNNKLATKANQKGELVGVLFAHTVANVQKSLHNNTGVGAVDIAVHFKSVDIVSESKNLVIFSKNKQSESSIEIKLATRIYPATGESDPVSKSTAIHSAGKQPAKKNKITRSPKKRMGEGD